MCVHNRSDSVGLKLEIRTFRHR